MSLRHFFAIVKKEISQIVRDPYTLVLVVLSPTMLMLIMAYSLSVDLKNIPIAILDQEQSQFSQKFVSSVTAGEDLVLYSMAEDLDEVEGLLERGDIKAAVVLAPDFSRKVMQLEGLPMQIIIDGTEPESGGFAVSHVGSRVEVFIAEILERDYPELAAYHNPIELEIQPWFNPSLKPRNDLIPGLISIALGMPAMLVALTISKEREHGTLEQLLSTPASRSEILLGKMFPYLIVGLVNVVVIPIFAILWFRVPFNGNFLIFFLLSAIFMFAILSMGTVIGVFMRSQSAALALSFLMIFFPGFFLTGIFFPIVSMPEIMRMESLGMPGTHYGFIVRGVFLTGAGFEVLWPYAVMLAILGVGFSLIAGMFFKKQLA